MDRIHTIIITITARLRKSQPAEQHRHCMDVRANLSRWISILRQEKIRNDIQNHSILKQWSRILSNKIQTNRRLLKKMILFWIMQARTQTILSSVSGSTISMKLLLYQYYRLVMQCPATVQREIFQRIKFQKFQSQIKYQMIHSTTITTPLNLWQRKLMYYQYWLQYPIPEFWNVRHFSLKKVVTQMAWKSTDCHLPAQFWVVHPS